MQSREGDCKGRSVSDIREGAQLRCVLMLTASFRRSEFKTPGLKDDQYDYYSERARRLQSQGSCARENAMGQKLTEFADYESHLLVKPDMTLAISPFKCSYSGCLILRVF